MTTKWFLHCFYILVKTKIQDCINSPHGFVATLVDSLTAFRIVHVNFEQFWVYRQRNSWSTLLNTLISPNWLLQSGFTLFRLQHTILERHLVVTSNCLKHPGVRGPAGLSPPPRFLRKIMKYIFPKPLIILRIILRRREWQHDLALFDELISAGKMGIHWYRHGYLLRWIWKHRIIFTPRVVDWSSILDRSITGQGIIAILLLYIYFSVFDGFCHREKT